MPISFAVNAFMASIKDRIATASKNSASNTRLLETSGVLLTMSASIASDNTAGTFRLFGYSSVVGKRVLRPPDNKMHLLGADRKSRTFPENWKTE